MKMSTLVDVARFMRDTFPEALDFPALGHPVVTVPPKAIGIGLCSVKLRVYTDTSILGGCEDDEFREPSLRLLGAFERGELTLVLSEVTLRRLETAPEEVRALLGRVAAANVEVLALSPEVEALSSAYIEDGAIAARMRADALHIAFASVGRVDVLVSWNFRHIVNLRRIRAYNAVNLEKGYPLLEIRTPREVPGDG